MFLLLIKKKSFILPLIISVCKATLRIISAPNRAYCDNRIQALLRAARTISRKGCGENTCRYAERDDN